MRQLAAAQRRGSDDERTVRDCIRYALELARIYEHARSSDRGACFAESLRIGIHQPQAVESKVAQGARNRPDIERVARAYKDNVKASGCGHSSQTMLNGIPTGQKAKGASVRPRVAQNRGAFVRTRPLPDRSRFVCQPDQYCRSRQ